MKPVVTRRTSRGRAATIALSTSALAVAAIATPATMAVADPADCVEAAGAWQITADCVDPEWTEFTVLSEEDVDGEFPHHLVTGRLGAEGSTMTVTIALPPADAFEGRFFQYTYPFPVEYGERALEFALESGGYSVAVGNGGLALGYRHAAAGAKFAEAYAAEYYGWDEEIYGYLYGPSGGSFQTTGAAENTTGVWDGFAPFVQGTMVATQHHKIRGLAELVLGDKADDIRDAVLPGGSGDPYATLDEAEATVLREMTEYGIPLAAWEYPEYLFGKAWPYDGNGLLVANDSLRGVDPTYADDFWNAAGYVGSEDSALGDKVREILADLGDTEDNRWIIALGFYHRYALPLDYEKYPTFDQFLDDSGDPLYPQREARAGSFFGSVSGGAKFDGDINGKMIIVQNLYDTDAFAHNAVWYSQEVVNSLGSDGAQENFRLYLTDHADHQEAPAVDDRAKHLVDWNGSVEQALRDLAAWVEDGVSAPASTTYEIIGGQVTPATSAAQRHGIQPTVDLLSAGEESVTVEVGEAVTLTASAQTPLSSSKVVSFAWDCEGDGTYTSADVASPAQAVSVSKTCTFTEPGEYLVAVKVTSQRDGHEGDTYARVENLDRARVIVEPASTDPTPDPDTDTDGDADGDGTADPAVPVPADPTYTG
ncbi:hypothetical protein [Demequina sp.]|uniref:hypothetical protein n=1 Tax=Demequina sp. TaxID=2050685 RepID=UPI003A860D87